MASRTSNYHALKFDQLLKPAVLTGNGDSTKSTYIDMQGYEELILEVTVGSTGDAHSGSLKTDLIVEHSDTTTDGDFADAADEDIINPLSGATTAHFATIDADNEDDRVYITAYRGNKRYVRVELDRTGNHSTGTIYGITAIRGRAASNPTN
jgi:hypothetical protein